MSPFIIDCMGLGVITMLQKTGLYWYDILACNSWFKQNSKILQKIADNISFHGWCFLKILAIIDISASLAQNALKAPMLSFSRHSLSAGIDWGLLFLLHSSLKINTKPISNLVLFYSFSPHSLLFLSGALVFSCSHRYFFSFLYILLPI